MSPRTWAEIVAGVEPSPTRRRREDTEAERWYGTPRRVNVGDRLLPMYSTGALARALNRSPKTIRRWERRGILAPLGARTGSQDVHGQRRVYPGEFIDAAV